MQAHYAYSSSNGSDWTVSPRETYRHVVLSSSFTVDEMERCVHLHLIVSLCSAAAQTHARDVTLPHCMLDMFVWFSSYDVSFADGSSKFFDRVERPQLSFALPQLHQNDDDGTAKLGPFDRPTHLWNGVCEGFGCLGLLGQKAGPSFTLSRPLGPPG